MKEDIITRLNDPEQCMDAIDDAIDEIENLRAVPQPAAGPWRTDVENAPGYQKVLIRMCDGSGRSSYVCIGQRIDDNWSRNTGEPMPDGLTPIAFAEINTEVLE